MDDKHIALVTGASSGLGREIAHHLVRAGYRVFGASLEECLDDGIDSLIMDVQSEESVHECVREILKRAGKIDVLVNNAGFLYLGLAEETPLEDAAGIFETNFFGVVRMTNEVLPSMRERHYGRIINVSSLAGLVAVPGESFYSATKFALEGYSEALRWEVEQFGITVSLIEPGFCQTTLHSTAKRPPHILSDYDNLRGRIDCIISESIAKGDDPAKVGKLVVKIARHRSPRLRYVVGGEAHWVPFIKYLLPEWVFAMGMRNRFNTQVQGHR